MQTRSAILALVVASTWVIGVTCESRRLKSHSQENPVPARIQSTGILLALNATPVSSSIVELNVPVNAYVRKGEIVGIEEAVAPQPGVGTDATSSVAGLPDEEEGGRRHLQSRHNDVGADDSRVDDAESQLLSAERSALATEQAAGWSRRRLRLGIESEVEFERTAEKYHNALDREQRLQLRSADLAATSDLASQPENPYTGLREASSARRDVRVDSRLGNMPELVPVRAPSDGYIVASREDCRAISIAPTLERRVETWIRQSDIPYVRLDQAARVYIEGRPSGSLRAVVKSIGQAQSGAPGSTLVVVTLSVLDSNAAPRGSSPVTTVLEPSR